MGAVIWRVPARAVYHRWRGPRVPRGNKFGMDQSEKHAAERRRTWTGVVVHSAKEAEAISRAENAAMSPAERVELVWQLTLRMPWRDDATEFRLDRTVGRVERRRR
jgi:hypothetical protein